MGEEGGSTRVASFEAASGPVAAVGHRVVHGGRRFGESALVTPESVAEIRELAALAPLHTEPALEGISAAQEAFPGVPHVAVFDSAFHATIPAEASTYAVPARWREEWDVRRYGFHGLAVASVVERVQARRLVVCHLGGGCSVTAVLEGRSARRIVVGYDGSDASRRALDAAADLAGYGSTLAVVTVRTSELDGGISGDARARLQRRHVEARYHELSGEAAEQLVEKATELGADLLVVGRRSRSPLRALLGSVSARVVRRAPCDVLVVR